MRTPTLAVVLVDDVVCPGEGRAEVSHTRNGRRVALHLETVSGARATVYLDDAQVTRLRDVLEVGRLQAAREKRRREKVRRERPESARSES